MVRLTDEERAEYKQRWSIAAQKRRAVEWLRKRGGDGAVTHRGRVLAMGDLSPFARAIWLALEKDAEVEFYGGAGSRSRLRLKGRRQMSDNVKLCYALKGALLDQTQEELAKDDANVTVAGVLLGLASAFDAAAERLHADEMRRLGVIGSQPRELQGDSHVPEGC